MIYFPLYVVSEFIGPIISHILGAYFLIYLTNAYFLSGERALGNFMEFLYLLYLMYGILSLHLEFLTYKNYTGVRNLPKLILPILLDIFTFYPLKQYCLYVAIIKVIQGKKHNWNSAPRVGFDSN